MTRGETARRSALSCLVAALMIVGQLRTASADVRPGPSYEQTIKAALEAFKKGDWDTAYRHFGAAHVMRPSARTLRGLGLCAFEKQDYAIAATHLQAALDLHASLTQEEGRLPPKLRSEVTAFLQKAQAHAATVDLELTPPDARMTVNGIPVVHPRRIFLAPGDYRVRVEAMERSPKDLALSVAAGEKRTLAVELALLPVQNPVSRPEPVVPKPAIVPPPPPPKPKTARFRLLGESLVFWAQDLTEPNGFRKLCAAPCETELATGMRSVYVSDSEKTKPVLAGIVRAERAVLVRAEYHSTPSVGRVFTWLGAIMAVGGLGLAGYGLGATSGNQTKALVASGGVVALVGGIFLLVGLSAPPPTGWATMAFEEMP